MGLDFTSLSPWTNAAIFAVAALAVWLAGTRLSRYADAIAERTGSGQAFIGALLLGGLTSLPEIATTLTASLGGNAALAVNNLMGGVAMQVTLLAGFDAAVRGRSLSTLAAGPVVMLQAALSALLLVLAAAAMALGDRALGPSGIGTSAVGFLAVAALFLVQRSEGAPRWAPAGEDPDGKAGPAFGERRARAARQRQERDRSLGGGRLAVLTVGAGLVILAAGVALTRSGEALAQQTGLGSSFAGAVLVALATSLPEISTTYTAILLRNHRMAFSNVFGANVFDTGLLFVADLGYRPGPVLGEVGRFAQLAALLAAVLTLVFLVGLLLRDRRTVARLGVDSLVVLVVYLGGLALLYSLRGDDGATSSRGASAGARPVAHASRERGATDASALAVRVGLLRAAGEPDPGELAGQRLAARRGGEVGRHPKGVAGPARPQLDAGRPDRGRRQPREAAEQQG